MRQMRKRVLIIGAGPGGLATGMILSRSGLDVTILERASDVGAEPQRSAATDSASTWGLRSLLYPGAFSRRSSSRSKRDLREEVELIRLDPQYRIIFGCGGELLATPNIERMERAIAALCPTDAESFQRFLDDNRVKLDSFRTCLESPFRGWRDLLRRPIFELLPLLNPWLSLDQELARYFRDPRIRLAFSFQSKYLGMSPFNCPSLFSILSYIEYEHGVHHPIGGCGEITRSMARVVRELGGEIRLGETVEEILFERKRAVGARTRDGCYKADAVIVNADFAQAITRLVPDHLRRRWTDRKIARKQYSCSTFMMYLGIEGRFDRLDHHTIYIANDYARNLVEIEERHVLSEEPSFYVQNACVTDPALAPEGMSTLYVLVPVTHQHPNVDWSKERDRYREVVLRQLERIGISDLKRRIRFERIVTPSDWEAMAIYRGATFSMAHNLRQMLHLRPRNRFDDLDRVYLVGGGTHPGSGLPVIFESARISSRLLLEDLGLPAQYFIEEDESPVHAALEETEVTA